MRISLHFGTELIMKSLQIFVLFYIFSSFTIVHTIPLFWISVTCINCLSHCYLLAILHFIWMKVISKVKAVWAPCLCRSWTKGSWRPRAVIRPSTRFPLFSEPLSEMGCYVTVLYKEPCQSMFLQIARCIWFLTWKTFPVPKSIGNLLKCVGKKSWMKGKCVSDVVCLLGGQICTLKCDLSARLTSPTIWEAGLMLMFMKDRKSVV